MTLTHERGYDCLSELIGDELRKALRSIDRKTLPDTKQGLRLVHLSNSHVEGLLLPELPADASVPWRYEGEWRSPGYGLAPEPTKSLPIGDAPILSRFAACAIYG